MKYIFAGLAVVLLLVAAKPQKTKASWYDNRSYINMVMTYQQTITFNADMFPEKREGLAEW